ncbi:MAG: cyclic nucleotide-binding domain-containing protein [Sphingomonadales bacterium]
MIVWSALAIAVLLAVRLWGGEMLGEYFSPKTTRDILSGVTVALVVASTLFLDGLIRHFYWHRYWRRRRGRETPALIRDILTISLLLLGLSIGLWWQEGLSFTGLITASGATAVILGIALQTVIQDMFSGLSINMDGSYALGDWLTVFSEEMPEPVYGCVTGLTWRSTFLMLEDGRRLMVPNHMMTSNPVLNHSRPADAKRYQVEVCVDNRVACDRAADVLLGEAMKATRAAGLTSSPEPTVVIDRFDDDAIYFQVRFYAYPSRIAPTEARSIMYFAMINVLQRLEIPLPVEQVELSPVPELAYNMGPDSIPEGLRHASLFADVLDDEQILLLATRCAVSEFRKGAVLMEQGAAASSMFIILEGAARVTLALPGGVPQELAVLSGGDVVGEMSLMTGAPRSATVTAATRMRALEITKESIEELLQRSPELLQSFSELLARRQQEQTDLANRAVFNSVQKDMMARMKAFFSRVLG